MSKPLTIVLLYLGFVVSRFLFALFSSSGWAFSSFVATVVVVGILILSTIMCSIVSLAFTSRPLSSLIALACYLLLELHLKELLIDPLLLLLFQMSWPPSLLSFQLSQLCAQSLGLMSKVYFIEFLHLLSSHCFFLIDLKWPELLKNNKKMDAASFMCNNSNSPFRV